MIEVAAATGVIKLVSSSVGLIDKVYDSWTKYVGNNKIEQSRVSEYSEKIEAKNQNKELVYSIKGQPAQTLSYEELRINLSPQDFDTIDALSTRMTINVRTWQTIVRDIELETNLATKAKYEIQLDNLKKKIGDDLNAIIGFVEFLGFRLGDHYMSARAIARGL